MPNVVYTCSNLQPFSTGTQCMKLNSKTLENLEIFKNQVRVVNGITVIVFYLRGYIHD